MKTPVQIIRRAQFRHADFSTACLEMRTNGSKWSVVRYLPAGMDIGPDQWTWRTLEQAQTNFQSQVEYLKERFGFALDVEATQLNPL